MIWHIGNTRLCYLAFNLVTTYTILSFKYTHTHTQKKVTGRGERIGKLVKHCQENQKHVHINNGDKILYSPLIAQQYVIFAHHVILNLFIINAIHSRFGSCYM